MEANPHRVPLFVQDATKACFPPSLLNSCGSNEGKYAFAQQTLEEAEENTEDVRRAQIENESFDVVSAKSAS